MRKHSEEHRQKISLSLMGHSVSEETRNKVRLANLGNKNKLGKSCTVESRAKMSNSHKGKHPWNFGRKLHPVSLETRQKMSISHKGIPHSESMRIKMSESMKGRTHSEETKMKLRISRIRYLQSLRGNNKFKDTPIERVFESELLNRKIPFRKQVSLFDLTIVDFLIPRNVVVYCDGEFWHNFPRRRKLDIKQTEFLKSKGYSVYRFTGTEIMTSVSECVDSILEREISKIEW